ncbi:MAG: hypothetical protein M3072_06930 [Candidatus Dormibacteraeota bacterium]|nr:hypothetical protein [Candidatus Dormibacteraeota bacterium]
MTAASLTLIVLATLAGAVSGLGLAASTGATVTSATLPIFVRGAYGRDSTCRTASTASDNGCAYGTGLDDIAAARFNTVQANAWPEALAPIAARGLKAIVWVGGWNKTRCAWDLSEVQLSERINSIKTSPAVLAYYLADEPSFSYCPNAPAAFARRTALVHRLHPGSKTFAVMPNWDRGPVDYLRWGNAVDVLGFDLYPCHFLNGADANARTKVRQPCDFAEVTDNGIRMIEQAGITGYIGVLQDFQDCFYELPSNEDLLTQAKHWQQLAFHMAGYLFFSWNFNASPCANASLGVNLDHAPGNVAALTQVNTHLFARGVAAGA